MDIDPQAGLTLFNTITSAGKVIYEIAKGTSRLEEKQQLMRVYDTLMSLKRAAGDLEDENHNLKQKLRFKSEDFDFASPFYYEKKHPDQPLCVRCFANGKVGPMGMTYITLDGSFRHCLVCDNRIQVELATRHDHGSEDGSGGPNSWMGR
jgi:hypothetical protein